MNTKLKMLVMLVASLTIISAVSTGVGNYEDPSVEQVLSDEPAISNYDNVVSKVSFGENGSISKIESTTGIKELDVNEALLIGKAWYNSQEVTKMKSDVVNTVLSGTPVVAINNNVDIFNIFENKLPYCFDETAFINAVYYNAEENIMYCYSGSLETEQKSLEGVSNWLSNLNTSSLDIVTVETGDWSPSINSVVEKNFGEWGSVNIQNEYRYLVEDNYSYNYYCGLHTIEVVPKNNHRTVSIDSDVSLFNSDLNNKDRILYSYAPDGTNGVTTVEINLSAGYSSGSGVSIGGGISWSYGVQDITVHNYSNKNEGKFHLVHEFNTIKDAAKETRVIAPGHMTIAKCDDGVYKNGDYIGTDTFTFTFEKPLSSDKIETASFTVELNPHAYANPVDLTLNSNGATGNEIYDVTGDETYSGNTITSTHSQGGHILLNNAGYYKTGYRVIGLSTDPLATTPTYTFSDTLKITSDTTLYYIWEKI